MKALGWWLSGPQELGLVSHKAVPRSPEVLCKG